MPTRENPPVFLIDDDASVLDSLTALLASAGFTVRAFTSATAFLDKEPHSEGCVVVDLKMPGISGLDLQRRIADQADTLPVVFITAFGEVKPAVEAMKLGAIDFIQKPYDEETLLNAVRQGLSRCRRAQEERAAQGRNRTRLDSLTGRERDVLERIVAGGNNRAIAEELGISQRTVEVHRSNIMRKLDTRNVAGLLRIVYEARRHKTDQ